MLQPRKLAEAFGTYFEDMERCRKAKAYWALLHVTVCLPDICAALETKQGKTDPNLYKRWCDNNIKNPLLSGVERWDMRCRVLHQGRASLKKPGRYTRFAFGQPSKAGKRDHLRFDAGTLHIDVGALAEEIKGGVKAWIQSLEAKPTSIDAKNVEKHLNSLVRVTEISVSEKEPTTGQITTHIYSKTH
jgi:hypothetical protein